MKKIVVTALGIIVIFVMSTVKQMNLHATTVPVYKLSVYYSPKCNGYVARCGLPGGECDQVFNPTCFTWPDPN